MLKTEGCRTIEEDRLRSLLISNGINPDPEPTLESEIKFIENEAIDRISGIIADTEARTGRRLTRQSGACEIHIDMEFVRCIEKQPTLAQAIAKMVDRAKTGKYNWDRSSFINWVNTKITELW